MNIVKAIKSDRFERKLDNGLTEVKQESTEKKWKSHWFEDENGKKQSEYKSWYENGTPREQCFYKDGKRHGEYKLWYDNGTLYELCFYKDGTKQGEYKSWRSNGTLWVHCFYKDSVIIEEYI